MGLSLRNLGSKIFDQVNFLDNGRTFQQRTPTNTRSILGQETHNGVWNTAGNLLVKPVTGLVSGNIVEPTRSLIAQATGNKAAFNAAEARKTQDINQTVPGFLANNAFNLGHTGVNLGFKAPVEDILGNHAAADRARTAGIQAFNQTAPGQLVRPIEYGIANSAHTSNTAQEQVGLEPTATGAKKYIADPAMGLAGTFGVVEGLGDPAGAVGKVTDSALGRFVPRVAPPEVPIETNTAPLTDNSPSFTRKPIVTAKDAFNQAQSAARAAESVPGKTFAAGLDPNNPLDSPSFIRQGIPTSAESATNLAAELARQKIASMVPQDPAELNAPPQVAGLLEAPKSGIAGEGFTMKPEANAKAIEAGKAITKIDKQLDKVRAGISTLGADDIRGLLKQRQDILDNINNPDKPAVSLKVAKAAEKPLKVTTEKPPVSLKVEDAAEKPVVQTKAAIKAAAAAEAKATAKAEADAVEEALPKPSYGSEANKVSSIVSKLGSKVTVLRKIGTDSANALADKIKSIDLGHQDLRASFRRAVPTALSLGKDEIGNFWDVVEKGAEPASDKIAQAAQEWKTASPQIRQTAVDSGLKVGDQPNYLPREYDPNVFKAGTPENAQATEAIVKAGQADDINEAQSVLQKYNSSSVGRSTFGHFAARTLDLPGALQNKSVSVLERYLDNAARRTSEAEQFGPDSEVAQRLVSNVAKEGGDAKLAAKAVHNYLQAPDGNNPVLGTARAAFAVPRMAKAALSHLPQSTNVAVDTTLKSFASGWKDFVTRNQDGMQFVKDADTTNPLDIHGLSEQETGLKGKLGKVTAVGLGKVMEMNRSVATLAGKAYGDFLADKSDAASIARLRDLGVSGDIGSKLTYAQQLEAARGVVNETMFNSTRASTPIDAETAVGKTIGQYRTAFGYKQTGFLWNRVFKEAAKGNLAPLAKLGALTLPLNVGTTEAKNKISGSKEGPGGVIADSVASTVGGLPGEMAEGAVRYGKQNVLKTVAGDVAPIAGEAVDFGQRAQKAVSGDLKPLERYAANLIPLAGSRVANAVAPSTYVAPTAGSKLGATTDSTADLKKQSETQLAKMKKDAKVGDSGLVQLPDGRYAGTINGEVSTYTSLDKARDAARKATLAASSDDVHVIGDKVYYKDGNGDPQVESKVKYDFAQSNSHNALLLDRAKGANDLNTWLTVAQGQYDSLEKEKAQYNPKTEQDKIDAIELKQENLMQDAAKYQSYGGFTKGSSGSSSAFNNPLKYSLPLNAGGSASTPKVSFKQGKKFTVASKTRSSKPTVSSRKSLV